MDDNTKQKFDLHSQKGVAELLHYVRTSALPNATKTNLRELVLRYAQRGGDAGVREELEKVLEGITIVAHETSSSENQTTEPKKSEEVKKEEKGSTSFFGGRMVPIFSALTSEPKDDVPPEPETPAPAPTPEPEPALEPEPEQPAKEPDVAVESSFEPAKETPAEESAPEPETPAPAPTPEPEPAPEQPAEEPPVAVLAPEPVPSLAEVEYMPRIREIKREVTALVGNPASLVHIDNVVGRAYLSAVNEAIKKTNAGTRAEVEAAMQALEEAFVDVKTIADNQRTVEPEPAEEVSVEEPEPTPVPVSESEPEPTPAEEVSAEETIERSSEPDTEEGNVVEPEPVKPSLGGRELKDIPDHGFSGGPQVTQRPVEMPNMPNVPPPPVFKEAETSAKESATEPEQKEEIPLEPEPTPEPERSSESELEKLDEKQAPEPVLEKEETITEEAHEKKEESGFAHTLADEDKDIAVPKVPDFEESSQDFVPAANPIDTKNDAKAEAIHLGDDLMSAAVTEGLEQLLSQWKIFSSSGLFGMGPSGLDHPLYIAIKNETMISIIKGNFSGATDEVQQSIDDYLKGWRYEQDITYQHSETFEHFLRRVVKRILDRVN